MAWYDSIVDLGNAGVNSYSIYRGANTPAPAPVAAAPAASKLPTWVMPVAIGGGVLLLLVVLIGAFKK